ncbi:MAG: hypothetical protein JSR34_00280 [Proteobacteria bacterium]|nr:hypothetical protein [Pseudomonadota bacterium]
MKATPRPLALPSPARRGMRGQAMGETIVVALFFLVPLFLMLVLVGKFINMRSTTLQAARYTAFARTVYSASGFERDATMARLTDAQLANAVKMRFFSGNFTAITQTQNNSVGAFANNPLWVDQGGNQLVGNPGNVTATATGNGEPNSFATDAALGVTLQPLRNLVGLGFSLTLQKYYTAAVAVQPKLPVGPAGYISLLNGLPLTFSAHDTLLADGWSASDENYERCEAATAVPTSVLGTATSGCPSRPKALAAIGNLYKSVQSMLGYVIPDLSPSSKGPPGFGYVDVTDPGSVPADRLKNYNPPTPGGGSTPPSQVNQIIQQYTAAGFTLVSQTTQANGSVVLVFQKGGATSTVTVSPSGATTVGSALSIPGTPYAAWQSYSASLIQAGYALSGVRYVCAGNVTCAAGKEQNAIEVDAMATIAGGSSMTITIKPDPSNPGNSIITTG